jgi:hypothetical protein
MPPTTPTSSPTRLPASTRRQREDDKLRHGLLTYAVVESLEGKGGIAPRRQISTTELADYVIRRVEELAKAQQAAGASVLQGARRGGLCVGDLVS